ncbi:hypothetical protein GCM10027169_32020 [Gordonia jinhuaensis]|uniref:Extracellular solute-binding protein n=1 Tax=Gordonia jinhuaensis TaxID=1517702 RepID=A0A916T5L6_9ACTN|nr:substrate-binding domain-containing protein [Gordonia jinhuaensis]GGB32786.1 hypothetical protein GCM10011489_21160 [Gordonia jinhuaensis]
MGRHRTTEPVRRGVSGRVWIALLALIVVIILVVVWVILGKRIDNQGDAAARECVSGDSTVTIVTDVSLASPLNAIAQSFNQTHPVVRDHCITVSIRPIDPQTALQELASGWDEASMGPFPSAWIPASSVWSSRLTAAAPTVVDGAPESLVTSPVVLAMRGEDAAAAAGRISWADLPALQSDRAALRRVGMTGRSSLGLAMPAGAGTDATVLAAEGIAAGVTGTRAPLTRTDATRATPGVRTVLERAPTVADGTTSSAVLAVGRRAGGEIGAVPVIEQQLFSLTGANTSLDVTEVVPRGATPIADFPVIRLSGSQVTDDKADAIGSFVSFVRTREQMSILTGLGFRGPTPLPAATRAVGFSAISDPMPTPTTEAAVSLSDLVYPH